MQEVSLLRNSFSTEYGQGQAVVSIVTKSGTNRFSGSAYEFARNDRFDARNYFAATKPRYERNQYGATAGGPVIATGCSCSAAYEGLRTTQGTHVPGDRAESGASDAATSRAWRRRFVDPLTGQPFPGNIIPASRFSKFAQHPRRRPIPAPNNAGANNYRVVATSPTTPTPATVRADQVLGSSHSLFQRFMWYDGSPDQPGAVHVHEPAAEGPEPRGRAKRG